jgi:crossover junction endodeoxyribonuclease RusA
MGMNGKELERLMNRSPAAKRAIEAHCPRSGLRIKSIAKPDPPITWGQEFQHMAPMAGRGITLFLPWPPSINHYYRHVGHKTLISAEGRAYKKTVAAYVLNAGLLMCKARVSMWFVFHAPDNRARDGDNLLKPLTDALKETGVIVDDCRRWLKGQSWEWCDCVEPGGRVDVVIQEYNP